MAGEPVWYGDGDTHKFCQWCKQAAERSAQGAAVTSFPASADGAAPWASGV